MFRDAESNIDFLYEAHRIVHIDLITLFVYYECNHQRFDERTDLNIQALIAVHKAKMNHIYEQMTERIPRINITEGLYPYCYTCRTSENWEHHGYFEKCGICQRMFCIDCVSWKKQLRKIPCDCIPYEFTGGMDRFDPYENNAKMAEEFQKMYIQKHKDS